MSDALTTTATGAVAAGAAALEAATKALGPGWTAIAVPLEEEGARALEKWLTQEIPLWEKAAVSELETLGHRFLMWLNGLFTGRKQYAINRDLLPISDAGLVAFWVVAVTPIEDRGQRYESGWTMASIRRWTADIANLIDQRGLTAEAQAKVQAYFLGTYVPA